MLAAAVAAGALLPPGEACPDTRPPFPPQAHPRAQRGGPGVVQEASRMRAVPPGQKGCVRPGVGVLCCAASSGTPAAVLRGAWCGLHPAYLPRLKLPAARAQEAAKNPKVEDLARELKAKAEQASIIGHLEMPDNDDKCGTLHDGSGGTYSAALGGAWGGYGHAPHAHIMTETHVFEPVRPQLE